MPIPRLSIDDTALLIIDVQERLMPTITDSERVITNCALLLKMAVELEIPYLVTEQNPRGLGRTVRQIDAAMSDVSMRVEKNQFSALVDIVGERLHAWRRPTIHYEVALIGYERLLAGTSQLRLGAQIEELQRHGIPTEGYDFHR